MENPPSAGSPNQRNKARKKQIKVVYITNPMRVKATAAEFKGLVQELTGQDSDVAERLSKFGEMEQADGGPASAGRGSMDGSLASITVARPPADSGKGEIHEQQRSQPRLHGSKGEGMIPYDGAMLDEEYFSSQILEDFESFMPSTSYSGFSPATDDSNNLGTA